MHTLRMKVWNVIAQCPLQQWNRWGVRLACASWVLASGTALFDTWQAQQPQALPPTLTLMLHGQTFELEVAATEAQKQKGLQSRPRLLKHQGMLFPFRPAQSVSFWLWRTQPLDLVFLSHGQVVGLAPQLPTCTLTLPTDCPLYHSPGPITDVVELPSGSTQGLRVGDGAVFLPVFIPGAPPVVKSSLPVKEVRP